MMKKTLILAAAMLFAVGVAANAYILQARIELPDGSNPTTLQFGDVPPGSVTGWIAAMPPYLAAALLQPGTDTKLTKLFAVPAPAAYEAIVWGTPDLVPTTAKLKFWCQNLGNDGNTGRKLLPSDLPWMILGPGGQELWSGVITATGTSTSPLVTLDIPIVKLAQADRETAPIYTFTQIPEPGSVVALCSGLIGLVGFGIRRRK